MTKIGQASEAREKVFKKNVAWDVANNHCVDKFFQKKLNKSKHKKHKKRTFIGVNTVVQFIADNVYRATFRKSVETEKWQKMTNDEDGMSKKIVTF